MNESRRRWLKRIAAAGFSIPLAARIGQGETTPPLLENIAATERLGVVTASFSRFLGGPETKLSLLELPQFIREEWGLRIVDFNSMNFPSFEPSYLEKLRSAVAEAGCIGTNLKMNQKVDMASSDSETRREAMRIYKSSVDAAAGLGLRWVRPLPGPEMPDQERHLEAWRELIAYAGERGIGVLIENFGWMMDDADSVVRLVGAIGTDQVAVGLDTGNWTSNEIRYPALTKTYPLAVTCDFKAKEIREDFSHPAYDLERCFTIGRDAGFRGPWCFEYSHRDWDTFRKNLGWLSETVRGWVGAIE